MPPEEGTNGQPNPGSEGGTPTIEELQAENAKLAKQVADSQSMIGTQSTKISTLETQLKEAGTSKSSDPKTLPTIEDPAKGSPKGEEEKGVDLTTMTTSERKIVDSTWKGMSPEEQATLFAAAKGTSQQEKMDSMKEDLLSSLRKSFIIPPTDLFTTPDLAVEPKKEQALDLGSLIARTIQNTERGVFAVPITPETGDRMSAFTPRPPQNREPRNVPTSGGVMEMLPRK